MSDETSNVQVSVNLPQSLWERIQADVRGAGQVIIDALEAHLPAAPEQPVEASAPEAPPTPDVPAAPAQ